MIRHIKKQSEPITQNYNFNTPDHFAQKEILAKISGMIMLWIVNMHLLFIINECRTREFLKHIKLKFKVESNRDAWQQTSIIYKLV